MDKKVFLISGGSSGIGLAVASSLLNQGHHVISLSRSSEKVARAAREFPGIAERLDFMQGDVSIAEDAQKIAESIHEKYGVLHGLVNNAGVLSKGSLETTEQTVWEKTLAVNLTGPFILTKALLPLLKSAGGASVVNISSVAGLKPGTSLSYSVSKAGLDMFTRFLAGDLGPYGIRVNSVNPGLVRTHIHLDNSITESRQAYEDMLAKARVRYPLQRIGMPEDIASMVVFLLSEESSWITGSIMTVDGGVMVENDLIPPKEL